MLKNTVSVLMLALVLLCSVGALSGCGDAATRSTLDRADSLMEVHPDTALWLLDGIDRNALVTRADRARHSLLLSMALDKNYVDTTTFDILQPAIDYYADHGSADERLRTLYYQGRIYQNRGDLDCAMSCFVRATDDTCGLSDSLTLARAYILQGIIFFEYYDFENYIDRYKIAADIYKRINHKEEEFNCLLQALDGAMLLNLKGDADSIMSLCTAFKKLNYDQKKSLSLYKFAYALNYKSDNEISNLIELNSEDMKSSFLGNIYLAKAYHRIGKDTKSKQILYDIYNKGYSFDTLKFQSILIPVLKNLEDYKGALSTYEDFTATTNYIDYAKFSNQLRLIEDKHQIEIESKDKLRHKSNMLWLCFLGIIVCGTTVIVLVLIMRNRKAKHVLALHKIKATELENNRLKLENLNYSLAKKILQLEHDKKVLEAENLAHRVATLENEIDSLKMLLDANSDYSIDVKAALQVRIDMINALIATYITDNEKYEKMYGVQIEELTSDANTFMNSNRLAFQASHPDFIYYLEKHSLTTQEINYVCLYALGLNGKEVGKYINRPGHVNLSSTIRKKLGIDQHSTNLSIYIRMLLQRL